MPIPVWEMLAHAHHTTTASYYLVFQINGVSQGKGLREQGGGRGLPWGGDSASTLPREELSR